VEWERRELGRRGRGVGDRGELHIGFGVEGAPVHRGREKGRGRDFIFGKGGGLLVSGVSFAPKKDNTGEKVESAQRKNRFRRKRSLVDWGEGGYKGSGKKISPLGEVVKERGGDSLGKEKRHGKRGQRTHSFGGNFSKYPKRKRGVLPKERGMTLKLRGGSFEKEGKKVF